MVSHKTPNRTSNIEELRHLVKELENIENERKAIQRLEIIKNDKKAPICINCKYCQQQGFLFICPLFALPEDGEAVGMMGGIIYYKRKGHESKTYENTPKETEDCDQYIPLLPKKILLDL